MLGWVQAGDGFGFTLKAFGETALNGLDGDRSAEPRIGSFVYRAHASGSNGGVDTVGPRVVRGVRSTPV